MAAQTCFRVVIDSDMESKKVTTKTKPEPSENGFTETELPHDSAAPDPFAVDRLRLAQSDPTAIGVQEVLVSVAYKKPPRDTFFRVHPSPEYTVRVGLLELS